jgi:glutamine synthetase type III
MFVNKTENKTETDNKVWLVIEKNTYGSSRSSYTVSKHNVSLDEAVKYKQALEKLNDQKSQSYFLASDVDTVLENVAKYHNKSVENGSYYENHPEVKKPV